MLNVTASPLQCSNRSDSDNKLSALNIFGALFQSLLMFSICAGNALVVAVFWRCAKLRNMTGFLTVQLALADLLLGLCMPLHIWAFLDKGPFLDDIHLCIARYSTGMFSTNASVCSLVALTVDRLLAVLYPLRYDAIMTPAFSATAAILVWIPTFGISFLLPFYWHEEWRVDASGTPCRDCDFLVVIHPVLLVFIEFPFVILVGVFFIVAYAKILSTASRHAHAIAAQGMAGGATAEADYFKSQLKIAKTGAIVLGAFFVCWMPLAICGIVQESFHLDENQLANDLRTIATVLAMLNSALNPVIYAFHIKLFKVELKKIFRIKAIPEDLNLE